MKNSADTKVVAVSSPCCFVAQSLSHVPLSAAPRTTAHQAPLSPAASRVRSNSCPLSQWCHPTISSSVVPFSSRPQSFPASGSFPVSQFFTSGGQSIGASASASALPMSIQGWFPLVFFFFLFLHFLNWRINALQNFVVFCHPSTRISHRYTHVPSLPSPSLSQPSRLSQSPCLSSLSFRENSPQPSI